MPLKTHLSLTMLMWFSLWLLFSFCGCSASFSRSDSPIELQQFRWICRNLKNSDQQCAKIRVRDHKEIYSNTSLLSLDGCKSVCGPFGSLWPRPRSATLTQKLVNVHISTESLQIESKDQKLKTYLQGAFQTFLTYFPVKANLRNENELYRNIEVKVKVEETDLALDLDTDESYQLNVETDDREDEPVVAQIDAKTYFGARHALETLSQLITYDDLKQQLQIVQKVQISDRPKFRYRGLLLDTGRNYFSVSSIKNMIRAMSFDKLNVFHWHMNEQQSFPFVSQSQPMVTKMGAYSQEELYYPEDVQEVVEFAHKLGVIVLPEFDAPGHASAGWEWGQEAGKGKLVVCNQRYWANSSVRLAAEPNAGQLNPVNENMYDVLQDIYKDMLEAFTTDNQPVSMFHMGGDEVNFQCWQMDPDIRKWIRDKGFPDDPHVSREGYLELWSHFQEQAYTRLKIANNKKKFKHDVVLWTSGLNKPENDVDITKFLPQSVYVIQLWSKAQDYWITDLLRLGYRVIFSNSDAWYLDCGFGAWIHNGDISSPDNNWCSPFKGWKTMYMNSPKDIVRKQGNQWDDVKRLVLGGEATMWSEQVDETGGEPRIWPRMSAVAERLWSDPSTGWEEAEVRILEQRHRMVNRGIRADVIQPTFCRQNDGMCYMPKPYYYSNQFIPRAQHETDIDLSAPDENSNFQPFPDDPRHSNYAVISSNRSSPSPGLNIAKGLLFLLLSVTFFLIWINRRNLVNPMLSRVRILGQQKGKKGNRGLV